MIFHHRIEVFFFQSFSLLPFPSYTYPISPLLPSPLDGHVSRSLLSLLALERAVLLNKEREELLENFSISCYLAWKQLGENPHEKILENVLFPDLWMPDE